MAPLLGHMFYIGLFKEKHEKNLLVWNHKALSLDVGMKHHLVNLC